MSILLEQALRLPVAERRKLADDLYKSIDASSEAASLTSEQRAELLRRLEDYENNPGGGRSWEEIRDAALTR